MLLLVGSPSAGEGLSEGSPTEVGCVENHHPHNHLEEQTVALLNRSSGGLEKDAPPDLAPTSLPQHSCWDRKKEKGVALGVKWWQEETQKPSQNPPSYNTAL